MCCIWGLEESYYLGIIATHILVFGLIQLAKSLVMILILGWHHVCEFIDPKMPPPKDVG
jgi:hypothetical protein